MSFSSSQLLELFVLFCVVDHFRHGISRRDSMPSLLHSLITPFQIITYTLVPAVYTIAVVRSRLERPQWMNALALPDVPFGVSETDKTLGNNALRLLACAASISLHTFTDDAITHLGDQFHFIGRREKPRIVQTGPYAHVRHPMYSVMLLHELLWALMFWSYAPLLAFVATAVVFAVKIPMEEEAIQQQDDKIKDEYRAYMRKVPAKLVPHVW